jgi:hypothetical protein
MKVCPSTKSLGVYKCAKKTTLIRVQKSVGRAKGICEKGGSFFKKGRKTWRMQVCVDRLLS